MDRMKVPWTAVAAVAAAMAMGLGLGGAGCGIDEEDAALDEENAVGEEALEDGEDADVEAAAAAAGASCAEVRRTICHDSPNNCSYPEARECDPLPRALDRVSRTSLFPIAGSGHVLEDSLGDVIGTVTSRSTRLNWGQRRVLHGTRKVLAFAVGTDKGARSGWINESAIGRDLSFIPGVRGRDPGGTFSTWHIVASDNAPFLDSRGQSLKVVRTCGAGRNATDYLGRNGHVNLIFNLPGYDPPLGSGTMDSYPNDTRLRFRRAQNQQSIARPLFSCATGSPVRTSRTLSFLYGTVEGASTRFGWIAMPNVRPGE
jgi:hypothetical protein